MRGGMYVRRGSSSPDNPSYYLNSIGFTTHAYWVASNGLAPNSDGSGGTVADSGAVGYWAPLYQFGFSGLLWTQPTSASRPTYQATAGDGTPALKGNGTTLCLNLNNTSALDAANTVIFSGLLPNEAKFPYSYHVQSNCLRGTVGQLESINVDSAIDFNRDQVWCRKKPASGTSCRVKVAFLSQSTPDGSFAPRLFALTNNSGFSSGYIYSVTLITGTLTAEQMRVAVSLVA